MPWIGHTIKKSLGAVEKKISDWHLQRDKRRGRPKIIWMWSIKTKFIV